MRFLVYLYAPQMLYHTYWRCCGHSAAGLAVGVALAIAGIIGLARVAVVLPNSDDDAGTENMVISADNMSLWHMFTSRDVHSVTFIGDTL